MSNGELSQVSQLSKWEPSGTDEASLLNELRVCLSLSIENVMKAAKIVKRFDELDISTARLDIVVPATILKRLRWIAHGKLIPEVFISLNGRVQELVALLPVETQKDLLDGTPVEVLQDGEVKLIHVKDLSPPQASLAFRTTFSSAFLRTIEEQGEFLKKKTAPPAGRSFRDRTSHERPERIVVTSGDSWSQKIKSHADALLELLNLNELASLDSDTVLSLKMLQARCRGLEQSSRVDVSGGVVGRIMTYLDVNGPTLASSAAMAIGITQAEFMEAVNGNRGRFVVAGKEISLAGHRI